MRWSPLTRIVVTFAMFHGAAAFLTAPIARSRPASRAFARSTAKAQTTAVGPEEGQISRQGEDLRQRGFTVLSQPVMPTSVVNEARTESTERLSSLLKQVEEAGFDPIEQQFEFREIATRQRNRWDLQRSLPGLDDDTAWASLCRQGRPNGRLRERKHEKAILPLATRLTTAVHAHGQQEFNCVIRPLTRSRMSIQCGPAGSNARHP